jgi:UDP-N-acetylmuramate--alanine ligase
VPLPGISSEALAAAIHRLQPELQVAVTSSIDDLADAVVEHSRPGDLVLAMGAGDVNGLWSRLDERQGQDAGLPLAA